MKQSIKILDSATQELTNVTIEHCKKTVNALAVEEWYVRNNFLLSEWEAKKLDVFEYKKERKCKILKGICAGQCFTPSYTHCWLHKKYEATSRSERFATTEPNAINPSEKELSKKELSVLSRGLTFCPGNETYDEFTLVKNKHDFARNLRLE